MLVVGANVVANAVLFAEVERRILHARELARSQDVLIDGGHVARIDLQFVVEDGAVALALQVEEGMVRKVAQRRGIGSGRIADNKLIVMRQGVTHGHIEVAWETVLAIGKNGVHLYHAVVDRNHIPNTFVCTSEAAMQRVLAVILSQLILNIIQSEFGIGNAVGATPNDGTQITLAFVVQILLDTVVTKNNILETTAIVRHPKGDHTTAVVGDLHRQKTIAQGIKRNLLAVHLSIEVFGGNQLDFFLFWSATD